MLMEARSQQGSTGQVIGGITKPQQRGRGSRQPLLLGKALATGDCLLDPP
jgi:hypothetical protein